MSWPPPRPPWRAELKLATETYRCVEVQPPAGRVHRVEVAVRAMMHGEIIVNGQVRGRIERNARPNGSVEFHLDGTGGSVPAVVHYESLLAIGGITGVGLVIDGVLVYHDHR